MFLAIDVGNTNAVLGYFTGGRLQKTWRVSTHPICTGDEFRSKVQLLFQLDGLDWKQVNSIVVSSVVPPFTEVLRSAFRGMPFHLIDSSWPFSFKILPTPANQVGADRLVNAEAAMREYGAPAIVVDSGTATTICALNRAGEYLGGAIMPGIELSIQALAQKTAKLFAVELVVPERAIGRNTSEAMRSGILYGYAAMIDGMVKRFKAELGEPSAPVVATGGVSTLLQGIANELTHVDPDLTLKGISALYAAFRAR